MVMSERKPEYSTTALFVVVEKVIDKRMVSCERVTCGAKGVLLRKREKIQRRNKSVHR